MSEKMTCPVCNSRTSSVLNAVSHGDPCPVCGTPADTVLQVEQLRELRADGALKARVEELLIELGKVTAERDRLAQMVEAVRYAMENPDL